MSSRYPFPMRRTPWFPLTIEVRRATGRDAFGRPKEYGSARRYAARLSSELNAQMIDGQMRAEQRGVVLDVAATDIAIGELLTYAGDDYTVTSVLPVHDHRGEAHVQQVQAFIKRGEGGR